MTLLTLNTSKYSNQYLNWRFYTI